MPVREVAVLYKAGVTVMFKTGRKLVGDRTAKSRQGKTVITESKFADDAALYAVIKQAVKRERI